MKKQNILLSAGLILLSLILHLVHIAIFKDPHHLLIYLMGDIAFVPLEVFLVTLVLDRFIERREHQKLLNKTNMLIGLFYQELGTQLLKEISGTDSGFNRKAAIVKSNWADSDFKVLTDLIGSHNHKIAIEDVDYNSFQKLIGKNQQLMINLLTNQALQEHEEFTDTLLSVSHLLEELNQRDLTALDEEDRSHLQIDIERVYKHLSVGWVAYMAHIKKEYPFLFASALRMNPFRDDSVSRTA